MLKVKRGEEGIKCKEESLKNERSKFLKYDQTRKYYWKFSTVMQVK